MMTRRSSVGTLTSVSSRREEPRRESSTPLRVLHFDIEARPLGWYGGDFTHKEPTAIAWAWADDPDRVRVEMLTPHPNSAETMLKRFYAAYEEAGIVSGHYIRGFDLPALQAAYAEYGLPLLGPKLTSDTKADLPSLHGISKSQENLGSWLGIEAPKVGMSMEDWRRANRLTEAGRALVRERVVGDVQQHIQLRAALMERGLLGPPKLWSGVGKASKYEA